MASASRALNEMGEHVRELEEEIAALRIANEQLCAQARGANAADAAASTGQRPMPDRRTVTYPADVIQRVADRLGDLDWNLPGDEALGIARDIVIDVTDAVDKLRQLEAGSAG